MHRVTRTIDFCYGHRLLGYEGKCRYLHGHNGVLEVDIESESLNKLGMVLDFTELRDRVKVWIDLNLDHKMILCRQDPIVSVLCEMGEPIYLIDENPTAENISKQVYHWIQEQGLNVVEVRLWETPSSCAGYRET